jgi:hypothetical protein
MRTLLYNTALGSNPSIIALWDSDIAARKAEIAARGQVNDQNRDFLKKHARLFALEQALKTTHAEIKQAVAALNQADAAWDAACAALEASASCFIGADIALSPVGGDHA